MAIERLLRKKIQQSTKSILLLGPRQTGKSTLLEELEPDLTINLAMESEFLRFSTDVGLFESMIASKELHTLFIDEIQRIPGLLNSIQVTMDRAKKSGRKLKFLLSGSSARKLRRGSANLLPGRIFSFEIGGFCAQELGYQLDVQKALSVGTLPEPYCESDPLVARKLLRTYSATYLKEEIQAEALARDIQGFARFLNSMASWSGQVLDFSKIATKAKVSRSSCIRFIEILEDTLVGQRVSVFEADHPADIIKHPKFYFFDPGVLNGLLNNFETSQDRVGNLFEHLVYSQLRNSAMAQDEPIDIHFFRTKNGVEVDFIVRFRDRLWTIEAKTGEMSTRDFSGLKTFSKYYQKNHTPVIVTLQPSKYERDGILIRDLPTLLKEMGL